MKDYYKILNVSKDASSEEIRQAFYKLAQQYHPDKGGDPEKFKEINEAYQVLKDKNKRSQYDQFGSTFDQGGAGFSGGNPFSQGFGGAQGFDFSQGFEGFDFGDVFSDFFGAGSRSASRTQSEDIKAQLELTLKEVYSGVDKTIKVSHFVRCETCKGTGANSKSGTKKCTQCEGRGKVSYDVNVIFGTMRQTRTCPECNGVGSVPKEFCSNCKGEGRVKEDSEINVSIPAGIQEGEMVKVVGYGNAGWRGMENGDLYLSIKVKEDEKFKRVGDDITSSEEIPFTVLVLGGKINVETLDGAFEVKVAAGTKDGEVIRVKGKGMPKRTGWGGRGDELVTLKVEVPKKLSREQKENIQKLQESGL